jgi:hypothetical protein
MDEQLGHALPHLTGTGVATIVSTGIISDAEIHRLNFGDLNIARLNVSGLNVCRTERRKRTNVNRLNVEKYINYSVY